ncbi:MAG: membrane protein insertase YidC, partial [Chloroflexi bacterium]|nr:membrane protein insertase YidC [Chloroflexota bacterium]
MTPIIGAGFLGIEHFTPPWDVFFLPLFNLLVALFRIPFFDFALAIIVFTIIIRTILAPLFVRQIRSQKEMQRMQPLIREVQRKHKGNRQKVSEETMGLYKEHGVNPAAGCLPVVLQLPILFALYQALIRASGVITGFTVNDGNRAAFETLQSANVVEAVAGQENTFRVAFEGACNLPEYSQLPQFLPLNCQLIDPIKLTDHVNTSVGWLLGLDLAQIDNVFALPLFGGFALSFLAVIAAVLQFVQVKMTSPRPNPEDPTSGMTSTMTYTFPLLTIIWGGIFPSGLILYWIVYTGYLVVQQFLIMGWGNLFPIFGWQPGWAPSPEAG